MNIDKILDMYLFELFKRVIRKGEVKRKFICPPNFKFQNGKCVLISPAERKHRELAAKKTGRKLAANLGKQKKAMKKRAKSLRKRAMRIPTVGADNVKNV